MSRKDAKETVEVDVKAVQETLERVRTQIGPEDYALLQQVVQSFLWLTRLVREGRTTIARLRRLVGMSNNEKTADVLGRTRAGQGGDSPAAESGPEDPSDPGGGGEGAPPPGTSPAGDPPAATRGGAEPKPATGGAKAKAKGHGRRPASEYGAAEHICVDHESLRPGDRCPLCGRGTLYELREPARFLRIIGRPPLRGVCWDCQRLRCSGCGAVHTARAPAEAQGGKYDESAVSMIAVLCHGTGVPHHRLEGLQEDLQTPVPASTQWEALAGAAELLRPVQGELVRQAAQATVLHNDDSRKPVLAFMGKRRALLVSRGELEDPERTGLFTSAIVALTQEGRRIALFFTGRRHAGENLAALLEHRAPGLPPPIHMGDALPCNNPVGHVVIGGYCLAHGRRNFVDEAESFPAQCRHVLELIGRVFKVEETCRQEGLSHDERLRRHQRESAPVMDELEMWMRAEIEEKRVEPNSDLGKAINYLLKRWDGFTLFLRLPGAPLDNNICERALKMAIRHRNNSLFYRTQHGADIGDLYMSLIHTTKLCGENPVEYLTALQVHARAVAEAPAHWMPWNWRDTLAGLAGRRAESEVEAA